MIPAAVGFHCPDDVAQARAATRQRTTVLGGAVRENSTLVTTILIGINAVLFVLTLVTGARGTSPVVNELLLVPAASYQGELVGVLAGEWYRLLTAVFLHEQIWHIGLNMLALWILGSALEPVLGRWRFLTLFLLSGLGGSTASLMFSGGAASLGASGAVFGLLGALVVVMRRLDRDIGGVVAILGLNVVLGFVVGGIDWRAHLGGLAIGLMLGWLYAHAPRQKRTRSAVLSSVGVLLLLLAVLVGWYAYIAA